MDRYGQGDVISEHRICDNMAKTKAQIQADYVARKKAKGKCTTCTNTPAPGYQTCPACLDRAKAKYAQPKIGISEARIIVKYIHDSGIDDEAQAIKHAFNKFFNKKVELTQIL